MYAAFFGCREPPFRLSPDPRFLWLGARQRTAVDAACGAVLGGGGALVLGAAGLGKTILVRHLAGVLPEPLQPVPVLEPPGSLDEVVDHLALAAGLGTRRGTGARLAALAVAQARAGRTAVLCLDEAHRIDTSVLAALEDVAAAGVPLVLVGEPPLEARVRDGTPAPLQSRLGVRARLAPLSPSEVADYVRSRLARAGAQDVDVFAPEVLDALAARSAGVPRAVNVLADAALTAAFAHGRRRVEPDLLAAAWADAEPPAARPPPASRDGDVARVLLVPEAAASTPARRARPRRARRWPRVAAAACALAVAGAGAWWGVAQHPEVRYPAPAPLRVPPPPAPRSPWLVLLLRDHGTAPAGAPAPPATGDAQADEPFGRPWSPPPPRPSVADALDTVDAFRRAWERRDVAALRGLLADDAVADGRRGADGIAASYATLFAGSESLEWVQPSAEIRLEPGAVAIRADTRTAWRDDSGEVHRLSGVSRWRVVQRDGRPQVASLERTLEPAPEPPPPTSAAERTRARRGGEAPPGTAAAERPRRPRPAARPLIRGAARARAGR